MAVADDRTTNAVNEETLLLLVPDDVSLSILCSITALLVMKFICSRKTVLQG